MGLIKFVSDVIGAGTASLENVANSAMWKEYFVSGDMSNGILMKRAERVVPNGSRNKRTDENLISSGAGIDVQHGQCMIIVDNGQIVELCTEPGRYTYDSSTSPSCFCGENKGLKAFGKEILNQWSAGGQRFSTQRVYFINMCELVDSPIRWGLGNIAFHHTTIMRNGTPPIEMDMTLKGNGQLTMRISDPIKFYNNIGAQRAGGDNNGIICISDDDSGTCNHGILSNLKSNIQAKLAEAISTLGMQNAVPYTGISAYSSQVAQYINELLNNEWAGKRGFEVVSFSVNGAFMPTSEDKKNLDEMMKSFTMSANVNAANYDIQKTMARGFEAAGNQAGGSNNIFGMGMAMGAMGGHNFGQMQFQPMQPANPVTPAPITTPSPASTPANTWKCECGETNDGGFCGNCGKTKPVVGSWVCECGEMNEGDFCESCGKSRPQKKTFKCNKCGWVPEDGKYKKFCKKCGDPINEEDFA